MANSASNYLILFTPYTEGCNPARGATCGLDENPPLKLLKNFQPFGILLDVLLDVAMAQDDPVRIIPHSPQGIPDTGSFEVIWPGGKQYFYWDDVASRRLRPDAMTRAQALEQARALAREKRAEHK